MGFARAAVTVLALPLLLFAGAQRVSASVPPPDYYYVDAFNGFHTTESGKNTCVSASSVTWIGEIKGWNSTTQYTSDKALSWFNLAWDSGWNRYDYQSKNFGLDPEAWAKLMLNKSPLNYTYNDYRFGTHSAANAAMVHNINATGEAVGALVAAGRHAILVTGFASSIDPIYSSWDLYGFYVVDPWYNKGAMSLNGVKYNLTPDYYIPETTWNTSYHLTYDNIDAQGAYTATDGSTQYSTIWDGWYTAVLRKNSTTEGVRDPWTSTSWITENSAGFAAPAVMLADPTYVSIDAAVAGGIQANGLQADHGLGVGLAGVSVGSNVFVESVDPDSPSYYLVALNHGPRTVALAMVTKDGSSYSFGGVTRVEPDFGLPSRADAARAMGASVASTHAVWRPSADTPTPFAPAWVGIDAASNQPEAITMGGDATDVP